MCKCLQFDKNKKYLANFVKFRTTLLFLGDLMTHFNDLLTDDEQNKNHQIVLFTFLVENYKENFPSRLNNLFCQTGWSSSKVGFVNWFNQSISIENGKAKYSFELIISVLVWFFCR